MKLQDYIRDVPDYPKEGILFKDITPLLKDTQALKSCVTQLAEPFRNKGITKVCGIESRGFIFGVPLALELGCGFVPIRKQGKLPWTKHSQEYTLEYGTDKIEVHVDAVQEGEKILVVDDLLATGGTAKACQDLLKQLKADIQAFAFVIELDFLKGREVLEGQEVLSLIHY